MATSSPSPNYFSKHLFSTGVECATKLYYYSHNYPQNKESVPFIRHAIYNKRLLKALARSVYPDGKFISEDSVEEAASRTRDLMKEEETVLFDAIFLYDQMMARLPIVAKKGNELTVFHIQTKAFDSRKYHLANSDGEIHQKWRKYLLDFAYQLYLVRKNWPDLKITPTLVLPEKAGESYTDNLPFLLKSLDIEEYPEHISPSNQQLLAKIDVSDLISRIWNNSDFAEEHLPKATFDDALYYLRNLYLDKTRAEPEVGSKCKRCEFRLADAQLGAHPQNGFEECWQPLMKQKDPSRRHIFDLIGPGVNQWVQEGIYSSIHVPDADIFAVDTIVNGTGSITHKMRQTLQIYKAKGKTVPDEIIRPELLEELIRWQYPLHFLDFEAGNYAIPIKNNRSPYHLVVFQFSCHSLYEDGSWDHHQWIDSLEDGYPNYELVRQLTNIPHIEKGTIVQYSNFERNALKSIRRELMREYAEVRDAGELIRWIEEIIHRNDSSHQKPPYIADLSRQVKQFYYNREMGNSLSIKNVLRSVMSHSQVLKDLYSKPYTSKNYKDMIWWKPDGEGGARNPYTILNETGDSAIRRGTEAMVTYGKLIAQNHGAEELNAYRNALLKYCELDTLAMLMIYQHWKQKLDKNV